MLCTTAKILAAAVLLEQRFILRFKVRVNVTETEKKVWLQGVNLAIRVLNSIKL